jgi:segregation and condensation protein B
MMEAEQLQRVIEAILMAADEPLSLAKLKSVLAHDERIDTEQLPELLQRMVEQSATEQRGVVLVRAATGYRYQVAADLAHWVAQAQAEKPPRLSPAFLETLAIIAYRQPVTRAEIESVRGVAVSTSILRQMMEREWVAVVGHKEVPGRPALLATTKQFLNDFNLQKIADLPELAEIKPLSASEQLLETAEQGAAAMTGTSFVTGQETDSPSQPSTSDITPENQCVDHAQTDCSLDHSEHRSSDQSGTDEQEVEESTVESDPV